MGEPGGEFMRHTKVRRAALLALAILAVAQGRGSAAGPPVLTKPVDATKCDLDPQRTYSAPYLLVNPTTPTSSWAGSSSFVPVAAG